MPADYPFEENKFNNGDIREDAPMRWNVEDERLWTLLSVYADGEATDAEADEIEALLNSDAACANDFAFFSFLNLQTEIIAEVEPPAHLRAAILQATTQRPTFTRRVLAGLEGLRAAFQAPAGRYLMPAGALAAAALLMVAYWPHQNDASDRSFTPHQEPAVAHIHKPADLSSTPITGHNQESVVASSAGTPGAKRLSKKPEATVADARQVQEQRKRAFIAQSSVKAPGLDVAVSGQSNKLSRQPIKPRLAENKLRGKNGGVQNSDAIEPKVTPASYTYSPRPMMDKEYQRRLEVAMNPDSSEEPFKMPDIEPEDSGDARGSSENNATVAANHNAVERATGPRTTVFVSNQPMPVFNRRYVTGADLRRERAAATLGYTRSAVMSIERSEMTGSVVGRF